MERVRKRVSGKCGEQGRALCWWVEGAAVRCGLSDLRKEGCVDRGRHFYHSIDLLSPTFLMLLSYAHVSHDGEGVESEMQAAPRWDVRRTRPASRVCCPLFTLPHHFTIILLHYYTS